MVRPVSFISISSLRRLLLIEGCTSGGFRIQWRKGETCPTDHGINRREKHRTPVKAWTLLSRVPNDDVFFSELSWCVYSWIEYRWATSICGYLANCSIAVQRLLHVRIWSKIWLQQCNVCVSIAKAQVCVHFPLFSPRTEQSASWCDRTDQRMRTITRTTRRGLEIQRCLQRYSKSSPIDETSDGTSQWEQCRVTPSYDQYHRTCETNPFAVGSTGTDITRHSWAWWLVLRFHFWSTVVHSCDFYGSRRNDQTEISSSRTIVGKGWNNEKATRNTAQWFSSKNQRRWYHQTRSHATTRESQSTVPRHAKVLQDIFVHTVFLDFICCSNEETRRTRQYHQTELSSAGEHHTIDDRGECEYRWCAK